MVVRVVSSYWKGLWKNQVPALGSMGRPASESPFSPTYLNEIDGMRSGTVTTGRSQKVLLVSVISFRVLSPSTTGRDRICTLPHKPQGRPGVAWADVKACRWRHAALKWNIKVARAESKRADWVSRPFIRRRQVQNSHPSVKCQGNPVKIG